MSTPNPYQQGPQQPVGYPYPPGSVPGAHPGMAPAPGVMPQPYTPQPAAPYPTSPGTAYQGVGVVPQSAPRQPAAPQGVRPMPITPGGTTGVVPTRPGQPGVPGATPARPMPIKTKDAATIRSEEPEGEEEEGKDEAAVVARSAPPWLISLVFHMVLLIVLALLYIASPGKRQVFLEAVYAEREGEQLEDDSVLIAADEPTDALEQIITPDNLPPVDDPFAAPQEMQITPEGMTSMSKMNAPAIGLALTGRTPGMKKALMAAYGGTASTEAAVIRALNWLKRNQQQDGLWSLMGPYSSGGAVENKVAATAMALLAFQGHGDTHHAGEFKQQVASGWNALIQYQDREGSFSGREVEDHHRFYTHCQATIAVCELFAMTKDSKYRDAAQGAINYLVKTQAPEGGWRYFPGQDSDTSVTGWAVMALQSARMGELNVPQQTIDRVTGYLDQAAANGGAEYAYRPGGFTNDAMSAEGLLCRQYLGWKHDDRRLMGGATQLSGRPINWQEMNVYYWYYATQVMHHMEGDLWDKWNRVMRQELPDKQIKGDKEDGSWEPRFDEWGARGGGRLFTTCLCTYMLEVYYRHLPIYAQVYKGDATF